MKAIMMVQHLQGSQAVPIGSNERRSCIKPDVWMSSHQAAVPKPAQPHMIPDSIMSEVPRSTIPYAPTMTVCLPSMMLVTMAVSLSSCSNVYAFMIHRA